MLLKSIVESMEILEELKGKPLSEIASNRVLAGCMLWNLYTVVQSTIDLTLKIVVKLRLPSPETYTEAFQILKQHDIIPGELAEKLITMVRFRHILAHKYTSIDLEKAYYIMQNNLDDIKVYLKILRDKLAKRGIRIDQL